MSLHIKQDNNKNYNTKPRIFFKEIIKSRLVFRENINSSSVFSLSLSPQCAKHSMLKRIKFIIKLRLLAKTGQPYLAATNDLFTMDHVCLGMLPLPLTEKALQTILSKLSTTL